MSTTPPGESRGGERIAKVMARAGLCSRREAEAWIAEGRVKVNGQKLTSPALNVTARDDIRIDGKPLPDKEKIRLWRYHKPRGLLTTAKDPQGRPTVFESLPPELPRVVSIGRLEAEVSLEADGEAVDAQGTFSADIVQACAVTGDDLPVTIAEPISLRFVPEAVVEEEEVELEEEDLDEIPYSGTAFDLGEAIAQSLALAIDPYATGPDAERVRREKGLAGEAASGPFAALAALKKE